MSTLAEILVLIGAGIMFLASEVIDDLFIAGLLSGRCKRLVPIWIRRSTLAFMIGVGFIVAGFVLLRHGR